MNNFDQKTTEQVAEENRRATEDAYRLAREQQERDIIGGKKPVLSSVADSIRAKLEREEFTAAADKSIKPNE